MNSNHQRNHKKRCKPCAIGLMRRSLSVTLAVGVCVGTVLPCAYAQMLDTVKPVRGQVAISRDVNIAAANEKVSLNLRDANLRDVLQALAAQGKFNIILDESVEGTLTVDIKNIPVNKALEYIFTVANLSYSKDGNTVIVATKEKAEEKNLTAKTFKAIPVLYKDAALLATQLNDTIFKVPRPGSSTTALAAYDGDTNSLLIMGTDADIKLAISALRELDVPRNRRVYHIKHNRPNYVAQVLASTFFQTVGGGTVGNGGTSTSGTSSTSTVGTSTATSGAMGGVGGNTTSTGSGAIGGSSSNTTGGGTPTTVDAFTIGGVTFIPEPISSTLTVLATEEQLALIDSIIDQVDVRRPQVEIEVSLVEIQNSDLKVFAPMWNSFSFGKESMFTINGLDADGNRTGINTFSFNRNNFPPSKHFVSGFTINNSHKTIRGKVLANPTVVAMDGTASEINITDQVANVFQTTTIQNNTVTITNTITTQDAGVKVTLTPTIYNDGSVELKLQPEVSQPLRQVKVGDASQTLLSKRSLNLQGVRIKDGQTLVIGGLLRETTNLDIDKVPGLDKLPIVRAMFNATNANNKERTELVLMVTPHILKEPAVSYFEKNSAKYNNPNQGQIQPVSLPKFIVPSDGDNQNITPATSSSASPEKSQEPARQALLPPKKEIAAPVESVQVSRAFSIPNQQQAGPQQVRQQKKSFKSTTPTGALPRLELMEEVLKN
jgi:type II secretory pathway component GspD/PulD (secretin)